MYLIPVRAKLNFQHHCSSLQSHIMLNLVLKKHLFLLSVLKTVVLKLEMFQYHFSLPDTDSDYIDSGYQPIRSTDPISECVSGYTGYTSYSQALYIYYDNQVLFNDRTLVIRIKTWHS